jgi:hypothetical protein
MANLLSKMDHENSKEIHAHLSQHYVDFGKIAPEYKAYSDEELVLIRSGLDPVVVTDDAKESSEPVVTTIDSEKSLEVVTTGINEVKSLVVELEETVRLRFNILGRMFDEMQKSVEASLEKQSVEEPTEIESDGNEDESKALAEKLSSLHSLFSTINRDIA